MAVDMMNYYILASLVADKAVDKVQVVVDILPSYLRIEDSYQVGHKFLVDRYNYFVDNLAAVNC